MNREVVLWSETGYPNEEIGPMRFCGAECGLLSLVRVGRIDALLDKRLN